MSNFVQNAVQDFQKILPAPGVGDKVDVHVRISEGNKERIQVFQGTVLKVGGHGFGKSFTVRKVSNGVGVERTFPLNSPVLSQIKVLSKSKVRRSKLYYTRHLKGKASRLTTMFFSNQSNSLQSKSKESNKETSTTPAEKTQDLSSKDSQSSKE